MKQTVDAATVFFAPEVYPVSKDGLTLMIDPEAPHWIATDPRGEKILRDLDGRRNVTEVISRYVDAFQVDWAKGWLDCQTFLTDALRAGFIATTPFHRAPYPGRAEALALNQLSDLWLHLTNTCNLACGHCLVTSGPEGIPGLDTAFWHQAIDQGTALGVKRFYITGGEPFLRADIFDLMGRITRNATVTILTNAILLRGEKLKRLSRFDPARLRLQISLDGPTAAINDPIRGKGSFDATVRGLKEVIGLGISPTLTTVVNRANIGHLSEMVTLAATLGVKTLHLLLSHDRGRARGTAALSSPTADELLSGFQTVARLTQAAGIHFDNLEALYARLLGRPGVKFDLSNMAYESLCIYADGGVYPSAALAGIPSLLLGSLLNETLETLWRQARVAQAIRSDTVVRKSACKACYLKFICGGGDSEQTYHASGDFLSEDPHSQFYEQWIQHALFALARERAGRKTPSGYDRPILIAAMGEGGVVQEETAPPSISGFEVSLSPSACVLSAHLDLSRKVVRDFYGDAAMNPSPGLCCPTEPMREDISHIPPEVLAVSYGCGSPIHFAQVQPGEVVVDLGSGGGIDCFIAAKKVGPTGRVIGIDMTEEMIARSNRYRGAVAENLGYDVVVFQRGYLEAIPLPDGDADLVTSNCVVNLSPDKKRVLLEIWRVLKDFGRAVISDTVTERPLPPGMKANPRLWGECVSGALTEEEYLAFLERAGFYGLSILKKSFWKDVAGYRFYSVILQGFKFAKTAGCNFIGQKAIYLGPMQAVMDEAGHLFPRNVPVDVCTDTAAKLARPPYQGAFLVEGSLHQDLIRPAASCAPGCC